MPRIELSSLRPRISQQTLSRWGGLLVLITLVVIAGTLLVGFVRMTWTEHQINQSSERQLAINEAQRDRNNQLKGEAEYRESDVYAEEAAREQLGMAREGDTVLLPTVVLPPTVVPTAPAIAPAAPVASVVAPDDMPNYQRWWEALFPKAQPTP